MAEPQTVNNGLFVLNTGDEPGQWGVLALNPNFVVIDGMFSGVQTISATNAPITLTSPAGFIPTPSGGPTQAQNGVLRFTGALTSAVQVTLPLPGFAIIENLTTGAFVLSFRAIGSGQVIAIQQGSARHVYNDGTNVRFVNLPDVGTYLDIAASAVPAWITACTIPPYLNCDGSTFSAGTYPYLAAFLGGTTLPDLRGVSRYTLNQGTGRLTNAISGLDGNTIFAIKATQTNVITTLNLPPYTPSGINSNSSVVTSTVNGNATGGTAFTYAIFVGGPNGNIGTALPQTFSGNAQGGTSTPFGTVATGTVSGITMIRSA